MPGQVSQARGDIGRHRRMSDLARGPALIMVGSTRSGSNDRPPATRSTAPSALQSHGWHGCAAALARRPASGSLRRGRHRRPFGRTGLEPEAGRSASSLVAHQRMRSGSMGKLCRLPWGSCAEAHGCPCVSAVGRPMDLCPPTASARHKVDAEISYVLSVSVWPSKNSLCRTPWRNDGISHAADRYQSSFTIAATSHMAWDKPCSRSTIWMQVRGRSGR